MNPRALRFRLTAWHTALFAGVFVVLSAILVVRLRGDLNQVILETQARRARQIGEAMAAAIADNREASVARDVEAYYAPEKADRFIRITRADGSVLYESGPPSDQSFDPSQVPLPPPQRTVEATRRVRLPDGTGLLIASFRVGTSRGRYVVEVGMPDEAVQRMVESLALMLAVALPVIALVALAGGYLLVGRALRPAAEIAEKAEVITQHNLSERLPIARTGDELERLAVSLNHMIQRLDDAFQNSKRFVADASHELRTPLTVLRGELEELAGDARLAPDVADRLGSALEEVERLAKIVERLFALSRLDAGEAQSEAVRFDLGELAAATAGQMTLLAEDRRIRLDWETSPTVVQGDRARIKQVVVNLLDNAVKYTPEGGAVRLSVGAQKAWACLEVSDTGVGIPAEALPHIFERFYRADPSRSRRPDGAGLGLAIVKSICTAHGGTVDAESAPGRGSRFRVLLPLAVGNGMLPLSL